jgi:hypothetical protein
MAFGFSGYRAASDVGLSCESAFDFHSQAIGGEALKKQKVSSVTARDVAAGIVMLVIALDILVFVVGGVGGSYALKVPVASLSFLAIVNAACWALAIMDDGKGL